MHWWHQNNICYGYYFDYIFGGKPGQEIFDYAIDTFTGSSDQEQQPSEQPTEQPSEKPTEQPAEQPAEKPLPSITELKPLPAVKSEDLEDFIRKHLFERNAFYSQATHSLTMDELTKEESLQQILTILSNYSL